MAQYTSGQVAQLISPYFSGQGLNNTSFATAFTGIAQAESQYDTTALNNGGVSSHNNTNGLPLWNGTGTGEYSVGLWQINIGKGHTNYNTVAQILGQTQIPVGQNGVDPTPQQMQTLGDLLIKDPQAQAQAARAVYGSQGFNAWTTDSYVNGQPGQLQTEVMGGNPPAVGGVPSIVQPPAPGLEPGQTPTGTPQGGTNNQSAGSGGSCTGSILGQCDKSCKVIGGLGVSLLNRCQAKAIVSGALIFAGGVTMLIGIALLFASGKGIAGKLAEGAGAGVALIPGAEIAGAAIAKAGHAQSQQSKAFHADKLARRKQRKAGVTSKQGKQTPAQSKAQTAQSKKIAAPYRAQHMKRQTAVRKASPKAAPKSTRPATGSREKAAMANSGNADFE